MDRIEKLIKMLDSPKASTRYDACEWLRVAPSLNDAAIAALERASKDPDPEVRDAAQKALNLHQTVKKSDTIADYATLSCPSCGRELAIARDIDRFACAHCGDEYIVERAGGLVSLTPVVAELQQPGTSADKRASEQALPGLYAELAALEEEKRQLASVVPEGFSGRAVLGQFLLGVVTAVLAISAMPSETNPAVAVIFGAVVFFLLFFIYLYRYRRASFEEVRRIQEATAGLDEQIGLKQEEIERHRAIVPVRVGVGKPERAAISKLEKEIVELQEKRRTSSKQMNIYWLIAISLGLIACVISAVLVVAESELFMVSLIVGALLCGQFAFLAIFRNDKLARAVDQEINRKQAELAKHKENLSRGE